MNAAPDLRLPLIDHEAGGPLSVLVRAIAWARRWQRERALPAAKAGTDPVVR